MTNESKKSIPTPDFKKLKQAISTNGPRIFKLSLVLLFIYLEFMIIFSAIRPVGNIVSIKSSEIWPSAFDPVARFVANIDWETREVNFDASISKAYKDEVDSYIWRIDDGTGLVGTEELNHEFKYPGYYSVQLSIIDSNSQSDVATCRILFPPKRVISEKNSIKPKGTFFNFSKYYFRNNDSNEAEILSNYVDSDCGLSARGYNVAGINSNVSDRNSLLRTNASDIVVSGLEFITVLFGFLYLKKKLNRLLF